MQETPQTSADRLVYSVSSLVQEVKECLELSFPLIWVEGEISNFSQPSSGHWYFTLKDSRAQLRCAMFRSRNRLMQLTPEHGQQVLIRGRIGLYEARGEFQMVVEHIEDAGAGALQRAYEQLKARLQAEGLFDAAHKQALPVTPRRIGVITSATGAAIRDILSVLARRYPVGEVIVYPVPVQGDAAAPAIVKALQTAEQRQECDVLILARGGGSLEDLWAFNEESVARAIHACRLPIVSGVGHEVDFSIADFVADQRAATPSAAAELVSPDISSWLERLVALNQRLAQQQEQLLRQARQRAQWLQHRLLQQHPGRRLEQHMQQLDELELRLQRHMVHDRRARQAQLDNLFTRLRAASPAHRLREQGQQLDALFTRLGHVMQQQLQQQSRRLALAGRGLDSMSPLKTLERGFSVATDTQGRLITNADKLKIGDAVHLRLHKGALDCAVTGVHEDKG